ncbi:uncharacterized protein PADG_11783 [Paracoccidioides brasiliensis Pb18]|uniref:Uncharacterized protein n=1 Tax=Paracoccidioides brasiliensis (strain Pb18) TaxID=502780 RepID=A0A0A0HVC5_PARBD|nr:uncharacterized protein PADG_11783 [Paracoccidioides brasiliensis Pb18]KGM91996.1 hypothetical protein PADG_11783 [Paracoccidioides brasiliensis Pb18]
MAPGTSRSKFPRSPLRFYGTAGSEDSEPVLILPGQTVLGLSGNNANGLFLVLNAQSLDQSQQSSRVSLAFFLVFSSMNGWLVASWRILRPFEERLHVTSGLERTSLGRIIAETTRGQYPSRTMPICERRDVRQAASRH